jgi:predicted enzyme related to lactoylglutathione lyase
MNSFIFIIYVNDQRISAKFYEAILGYPPSLDMPGMTEFDLSSGVRLGIMPNSGIKKILNDMPDPVLGTGIPRCEIYLTVDMPTGYLNRAIAAGAKWIADEKPHDWGDSVAYCADPDGHILAFAKKISEGK